MQCNFIPRQRDLELSPTGTIILYCSQIILYLSILNPLSLYTCFFFWTPRLNRRLNMSNGRLTERSRPEGITGSAERFRPAGDFWGESGVKNSPGDRSLWGLAWNIRTWYPLRDSSTCHTEYLLGILYWICTSWRVSEDNTKHLHPVRTNCHNK